jgi:hydroxymethylpyrimidine kinase/phosphomethylpyrimidine kinase
VTHEHPRKAPIVLAIAGFDPSGGAGIIADIRTIEALGCIAAAAITSITFQNAKAYAGALHQSPGSLRAQVEAILGQHKVAAVKIGMLPTAEIIHGVTQMIREFDLSVSVIDPVMESTSGGKLMADDAFEVFVTELMSHARVITPNIPEAEKLAGLNITGEETMRQAASRIRELGARAVLIKGGHLKQEAGARSQEPEEQTPQAIDVLDDEGDVTVFRGDWIDASNMRGTGCMLSSAIACGLARGRELKSATQIAKQFVSQTIQDSKFQIPDSRFQIPDSRLRTPD